MKKWIATLLSAVLVLGLLAGCTGKDGGDQTTDGSFDNQAASQPSVPSGSADAASSGDLNAPTESLPVTDGDIQTEPQLPASDGDLSGN